MVSRMYSKSQKSQSLALVGHDLNPSIDEKAPPAVREDVPSLEEDSVALKSDKRSVASVVVHPRHSAVIEPFP